MCSSVQCVSVLSVCTRPVCGRYSLVALALVAAVEPSPRRVCPYAAVILPPHLPRSVLCHLRPYQRLCWNLESGEVAQRTAARQGLAVRSSGLWWLHEKRRGFLPVSSRGSVRPRTCVAFVLAAHKPSVTRCGSDGTVCVDVGLSLSVRLANTRGRCGWLAANALLYLLKCLGLIALRTASPQSRQCTAALVWSEMKSLD